MVSERECIDLISKFVNKQGKEYLLKGIGDDCAVLRKEADDCLLLTTDTLVQGVHFDLAWHSPYLLGRKSASVNLSDIAAMGGRPYACLLSIGFPEKIPAWIDDFMQGFISVLQLHDTLLVGGDTVMTRNDCIFSVTLLGQANRKQICYRSGAQPGDMIWVSGSLGNAAAGLALCRKGFHMQDSSGRWQQLIKAHLDPEALIELGNILASSGLVHAMMDISDGLATDLAHLCRESNVGAEIDQPLLPVSKHLKDAAAELDTAPYDWVLRGGEDYQLLFTTKESDAQKLRQIVAEQTGQEIFTIGHIVEGQGVYLCNDDKRQEISFQGYEHFRD